MTASVEVVRSGARSTTPLAHLGFGVALPIVSLMLVTPYGLPRIHFDSIEPAFRSVAPDTLFAAPTPGPMIGAEVVITAPVHAYPSLDIRMSSVPFQHLHTERTRISRIGSLHGP